MKYVLRSKCTCNGYTHIGRNDTFSFVARGKIWILMPLHSFNKHGKPFIFISDTYTHIFIFKASCDGKNGESSKSNHRKLGLSGQHGVCAILYAGLDTSLFV